ncbi:MAG: 50S ribosomal protein L20 [Erysipelothrix sp.]|nr:50S ribosomal protein L20 [Erysipelothrix sp.]
MARVKNNVASRARRKKRLKLAKGYFGSKHRLYRTANEQVMRSQRYAYIGRKQVKREMRKLWITRINAAARLNGTTYSQLTHGLRLADIQVNRKMLSEMAIHDEAGFSALVAAANKALENNANAPKAVKEVAEVKAVKEVKEVKEVVETVEVSEDADYGSNWADVVFNIIDRHVADEFTTEDVLAHQNIAATIYPKNSTIEATIKRNIAALVKDGKIVEVSEDNFKKA